LLKTGHPDVLMVDIGLAGMSGAELARKARDIHPTVGIVFATGQDAPSDPRGSVVLRKPYDLAAMLAALRTSGRTTGA
jgi:DNA-binding NarL/FixJ family response regulator